jgi:O-antigen ligase
LERAWVIGLGAFLVATVALGGTSDPTPLPALFLRLTSMAVIVIGLIRLRFAAPNRAAAEGFAIILVGVGLMFLQLVPLPSFVWMSLPGREFVVEGLRAAGVEPGWMPLSLSPPATRLALLALLMPIAGYVASLSLSSKERWTIVYVLLGCVIASILLGLAQKFYGPNNPLYFYGETSRGWATGTFANRNFYAALLYCSIPLTWAVALRAIRRGKTNKYMVGGFAALMLLAVIIALGAASSRAGILFAMLALLASATLGLGGQRARGRNLQSRWIVVAAIVALLVIGQFGMAAVLRLAEFDPVSDYRTQISEITMRAAWDYFPFGSGFGSFVPVYAMHETPATILSSYVNHAHNDWLEIWLEGGVPVILIVLAFLVWYGANLYRLWRPHEESEAYLIQRAGAVVCGLLILHSLMDYPLREPSLAVIFGLMCGFMTFSPSRSRVRKVFARNMKPRDDLGQSRFKPTGQALRKEM